MHTVKFNFSLYTVVLICNLLAFTVGIAISWTSSILPKLTNHDAAFQNPLGEPLTLLEESWIGALLPLGAIFGSFISGYLSDKIGRKNTIIVVACPMFLSSFISAFSNSVVLFLLARFLMGLSTGGVFSVLPTYLIEIAEDHNRGTLSVLMSIFVSAGILFSYGVGPLVSVQVFSLVSLVPLVILFPCMIFFSPESPFFLAAQNNVNEVNLRKSLATLRIRPVDSEIDNIKQMVKENSQNAASWRTFFSDKTARKALLITLSLMSLQQFAGVAAVIAYLQPIFNAANSVISPQLSVLIIGTIQLFVTILTTTVVDVLGRRILLLVSAVGSCLSLICLGTYFFLKEHSYDVDALFWLPILSLIIYLVSFAIGLGPLPWTIMAELFTSNYKSKAAILTTVVSFSENFVITLCFPPLAASLGMGLTFWLFAVVCGLAIGFVFFVVPETKGRNMKEIQDILRGEND